MRPTLVTLALAACAAPNAAPPDSDAPTDTDTDAAVDSCAGTWSAEFSGLPASPTSGTSWVGNDGATYLLSRYGSSTPDVAFAVDEAGCLALAPGVVAIDLAPTGCAGKRVTIDVTDRCGTACTEVRVLDPDGILASSKTIRQDVPERLEIAPADPFSVVVVGSLDALVCGVSVDRTALTDAMRPEDTGADF